MSDSTGTLFNVPALSREDFNRLARDHAGLSPFSWVSDDNNPGMVDPDELRFSDSSLQNKFISEGQFTQAFQTMYLKLVDLKRREVVRASLDEAMPYTFVTDLRYLSEPEKAMVRELRVAQRLIEILFRKEKGSFPLEDDIETVRESDPDSYALFQRNHGPWCEAPKTAADPFCNALSDFFEPNNFGVFQFETGPVDAFCESLGPELSDPMTVLEKGDDGVIRQVPFAQNKYYQEDCEAVARSLEKAAAHIQNLPKEKAMVDYLLAAANAFRTGDWDNADDKWVAMNRYGGAFAIRIAPDEQYADPCGRTAAFEFWFGVIDKETDGMVESLQLETFFQTMENEIGELVPLFKPRTLDFDMPDFVRMAMVSGDAQYPRSVIMGQMLPNSMKYGPRMNIFTGYYLDDQSLSEVNKRAELFLDPSLVADYDLSPQGAKQAMDLNTILHELTHSLGPNPYRNTVTVDETGTPLVDAEGNPLPLFASLGGRNAIVLEELKAQTGSFYWIGWLLQRGVIDAKTARNVYADALHYIIKSLGKGIVNPQTGRADAYAQISAVQLYFFMQAGAVTLENGKYNINFDKIHEASQQLLAKAVDLEIRGDRSTTEKLLQMVTYPEELGYETIGAQQIYDKTQELNIRPIATTHEMILE